MDFRTKVLTLAKLCLSQHCRVSRKTPSRNTSPKGRQLSPRHILQGKYGDMQSFVKQLKDMGYEDVRLIDTTDDMFMTKKRQYTA